MNSDEADRGEAMAREPVRGEWPRKAADMGVHVLGHASVAARGAKGTSRTGHEERVVWLLSVLRRPAQTGLGEMRV